MKPTRRLTYVEKVMGTCKHFTGTANDTCRAGMKYKDLGLLSLPCLKHYIEHRACVTNCAKAEFPTHKEAEAGKVARQGAGICSARYPVRAYRDGRWPTTCCIEM